MRGFLLPLAAIPLALVALGGVAHAQQSADSIINSLKPTGNLATGATRGIRLGGSAPAATPSPAHPVSTSGASRPRPMHQEQASTATAGPSVNLTVNFPTGSAELTPAAKASLDNLGKALSSNELANYKFRIEGHTDTVGTPEANLALSQQRADAVVSYLTSEYKVDPSRLQAVGMGEKELLVRTPPQTPEARNRRVQVINLGT